MRGFPCSIQEVGQNGQILTVNFETDTSVHNIPQATVPVWNPRYVRYPWKSGQDGDKGVLLPLNLGIGNMSGQGPQSPAPFVNPANLSSLVWVPIGNVNDDPPDNPNAVQHNAPEGTIQRDDNKKSQLSVHPTNGTQIAAGGDGQGNYEHTVTTNNGTQVKTSQSHTVQSQNLNLDAQGNLQNQGTHTAQGAITSATSMNAPTGSFAGGNFGGLGFSGGSFLGGLGVTGMGAGILSFLNGAGSDGGAGSGITANALASGTAATNVGNLGGDLSGTLPNPKVVKLENVKDTNIPQYNSHHAAVVAGLQPGQLYQNPTISATNDSVLCVMY